MSAQVIANVTETLVSVLTAGVAGLSTPPTVVPHDLRTDPGTTQTQLTVFLFEVKEDSSARNRPIRRTPAGGTNQVEIQKPEMSLLLRYLITPWGPDRNNDQIILGRVLQVFYDKPILSGSDLAGGGLAGTDTSLKLTVAPLTLEERTRVWQAVNQPYRLSITYEVRVVNIEPTITQTATVVGSSEMNHSRGGRVRS